MDPMLRAEMKSREIRLIQESWNLIEENKAENGKILFVRLFLENPEIKQLFLFAKDTPIEKLRDKKVLVKHSTEIINTVSNIVQGLENESINEAIPKLVVLGKNHRKFGAKPEHLPALGEAILFMLQKALGNKFCVETEVAWTTFYHIVSESIAYGMLRNGLENSPKE